MRAGSAAKAVEQVAWRGDPNRLQAIPESDTRRAKLAVTMPMAMTGSQVEEEASSKAAMGFPAQLCASACEASRGTGKMCTGRHSTLESFMELPWARRDQRVLAEPIVV